MEKPPLPEPKAIDNKVSTGRINLDSASILLMDNAWGVEILTRIFMGFGARRLHRAQSVSEASNLLEKLQVDLIVSEAMIDGEDVFDFIRGVRLGAAREPHRFIPVILLSAHTASHKVALARDCGINFFLAKPVSPKVVMDRVLWVAKGGRKYVVTPTYAGPDRRFRAGVAPNGAPERRGAIRPTQMQGRSA